MLKIYAVRVPSTIDENLYNKLLTYLSFEKRVRVVNFVKKAIHSGQSLETY